MNHYPESYPRPENYTPPKHTMRPPDMRPPDAPMCLPSPVRAPPTGRQPQPAAAAASSLPVKKQKRQYIIKNPNRPKRPLSAYNLFFRAERERIVKKNLATSNASGNGPAPETLMKAQEKTRTGKRVHRKTHGAIGFAELGKRISSAWKNLDAESRSTYEADAKKEKERYSRELEASLANLPPAPPQQPQPQPPQGHGHPGGHYGGHHGPPGGYHPHHGLSVEVGAKRDSLESRDSSPTYKKVKTEGMEGRDNGGHREHAHEHHHPGYPQWYMPPHPHGPPGPGGMPSLPPPMGTPPGHHPHHHGYAHHHPHYMPQRAGEGSFAPPAFAPPHPSEGGRYGGGGGHYGGYGHHPQEQGGHTGGTPPSGGGHYAQYGGYPSHGGYGPPPIQMAPSGGGGNGGPPTAQAFAPPYPTQHLHQPPLGARGPYEHEHIARNLSYPPPHLGMHSMGSRSGDAGDAPGGGSRDGRAPPPAHDRRGGSSSGRDGDGRGDPAPGSPWVPPPSNQAVHPDFAFQCEVCNNAVFSTFQECADHEEACARKRANAIGSTAPTHAAPPTESHHPHQPSPMVMPAEGPTQPSPEDMTNFPQEVLLSTPGGGTEQATASSSTKRVPPPIDTSHHPAEESTTTSSGGGEGGKPRMSPSPKTKKREKEEQAATRAAVEAVLLLRRTNE